jgi:hypothetical protein
MAVTPTAGKVIPREIDSRFRRLTCFLLLFLEPPCVPLRLSQGDDLVDFEQHPMVETIRPQANAANIESVVIQPKDCRCRLTREIGRNEYDPDALSKERYKRLNFDLRLDLSRSLNILSCFGNNTNIGRNRLADDHSVEEHACAVRHCFTVGFACICNCDSTKAATCTGSTWARRRRRVPVAYVGS